MKKKRNFFKKYFGGFLRFFLFSYGTELFPNYIQIILESRTFNPTESNPNFLFVTMPASHISNFFCLFLTKIRTTLTSQDDHMSKTPLLQSAVPIKITEVTNTYHSNEN